MVILCVRVPWNGRGDRAQFAFMCACGGGSVGVLSHSIGTAILIRGVQDFIAGVAGMWTGEFDVRQWAIDACVAIAVDVAAVGCAGCV